VKRRVSAEQFGGRVSKALPFDPDSCMHSLRRYAKCQGLKPLWACRNGMDLSLLEQVSPIEWDNVVLMAHTSSI
jgi:hypothetical protein